MPSNYFQKKRRLRAPSVSEGRWPPSLTLGARIRHSETDGASALDLYTLPEGDVAGDVLGRGLGRRIVPGGIRIDLAVDYHVVVTGGAFPAADGVRLAVLKILPANRVGREIVVAFHHLRRRTFGQGDAVPGCTSYGVILLNETKTVVE